MADENSKGSNIRIDNNPDKKVNISNIQKQIKKNPWIISTIVLGIVGLILLIMVFRGGITGNVISADIAGQRLVDFANSQGVVSTLVGVNDTGEFYEVIISINGQNLPLYVTKDGEFFTQSLIPLTGKAVSSSNTETSADIPKADKPKAELYIFSYCPAGTAALDTFAKVGKLLNNAADLKVKFFSNMHGEHEKQQNLIQECIQDTAKDKYWDYASQYVKKVYDVCGTTRDISCDKNESIKLMKSVGINSDSVMACVAQKGEALYTQDKNDADKNKLSASPSLVVNDVSLGASFDRSSEGIKTLICDSFNTAPKECGQTLGTAATTSTGSC